MSAKTQKALMESIAHWERMLELKTLKQRVKSKERPDANGCALCGLFFHLDCVGCPVAKKTGAAFCDESKTYVVAHWLYWENDNNGWQKACKAQIAFLKSLLPAKP